MCIAAAAGIIGPRPDKIIHGRIGVVDVLVDKGGVSIGIWIGSKSFKCILYRRDFYPVYKGMQAGGPQAGNKIIQQKPLPAPYAFQNPAKHPQGKHIKEQVHETSMHEHVRGKLVRPEIFRAGIV